MSKKFHFFSFFLILHFQSHKHSYLTKFFATSEDMLVSKIEGQNWNNYLETMLALKCLITTSKKEILAPFLFSILKILQTKRICWVLFDVKEKYFSYFSTSQTIVHCAMVGHFLKLRVKLIVKLKNSVSKRMIIFIFILRTFQLQVTIEFYKDYSNNVPLNFWKTVQNHWRHSRACQRREKNRSYALEQCFSTGGPRSSSGPRSSCGEPPGFSYFVKKQEFQTQTS